MNINEIVEGWKGNRKCGAKFDPKAYEKIASTDSKTLVPLLSVNYEIPLNIDLDTAREQNQGGTPHCVAYSFALAGSSRLSFENHNRETIEGAWLGKELVKAGIMTKDGAYLAKVAEWLNENPVITNLGNRYQMTIKRIKRSEITDSLRNGYQIVTGSNIHAPFYDKKTKHCRPASRTSGVGGHAWRIVGRDIIEATNETNDCSKDSMTFALIMGNSWNCWGIDKHGNYTNTAYLDPEDLRHCFECYVVEKIELVTSKK